MSPTARTRVVVVGHGPPVKGGITTVTMDLVEDPGLNDEFEMVLNNTSQNDAARGKFDLANLRRAVTDATRTYRLARRGGIVHSHSVQEPWLVGWRQVAIALAGRLKGARVLMHNHAQPPYMELPGEYRVSRLNRWAFAALDRLVEANILIAAAGEPNLRQYMPTADLPVIANSVDVPRMVATTADHDPPVVLFIGELLERKGLVDLLDAVDLLEERGAPAFELRIIGDNRPGLDPDKDRMVAEVTSRGRAATMTGPLSREQVYEHLSQADMYVFPTFTEGQPFTVIESLAAGVPIVATTIQAITNMVDDPAHARLVPVRAPEALADAMEELLRDPAERRRMSAANRELAMERFDRSVFRARIAEQYRRYARA